MLRVRVRVAQTLWGSFLVVVVLVSFAMSIVVWMNAGTDRVITSHAIHCLISHAIHCLIRHARGVGKSFRLKAGGSVFAQGGVERQGVALPAMCVGKAWLAAQAWLRLEGQSISTVLSMALRRRTTSVAAGAEHVLMLRS